MNVASRPTGCETHQAAAEPGTVLVTSTVLRQVAGLFIVEDKGAHELKGALAPTNLYRILRISGVPLFVEEVTRLLLERGQPGGLQAIPPTLRQSLAARLDTLGEAREVAQIGAVYSPARGDSRRRPSSHRQAS